MPRNIIVATGRDDWVLLVPRWLGRSVDSVHGELVVAGVALFGFAALAVFFFFLELEG